MSPKISVIIPTFNEQTTIASCLQSLQQQTQLHLEIIVVDDGSTDQTISRAKQLISGNQIKIFRQPHQGPGTARNLGAHKSRGDILVFVDADMTFDPQFIAKLVQPILNRKTIGTFTKDERVSNSDNPWANSWSLLRGFKSGHMHPENYPDHQPVFRAIMRQEFVKVGGFDINRGYDDDWSLSEKLGKKATLVSGAIIYHTNPNSLQEIFTQSRWMAKRRYKYGLLGMLIALFRASLPISLMISTIMATKHTNSHLFLSKLVSDTGIYVGIIQLLLTGSTSK